MTRRIVVATNNAHKVDEIRSALSVDGWEFVTLADVGAVSDPVEDGDTFLANARIKARAAHAVTGRAAIADDSGLVVDALDGRPGVYSSRYAGEGATDADNNAKLLQELAAVPDESRTARFRSVIVFVDETGSETVGEGSCEGRIARDARGGGGFGYDPLFMPDATPGRSMAELSMAEKNAISHRGAALQDLAAKLRS